MHRVCIHLERLPPLHKFTSMDTTPRSESGGEHMTTQWCESDVSFWESRMLRQKKLFCFYGPAQTRGNNCWCVACSQRGRGSRRVGWLCKSMEAEELHWHCRLFTSMSDRWIKIWKGMEVRHTQKRRDVSCYLIIRGGCVVQVMITVLIL